VKRLYPRALVLLAALLACVGSSSLPEAPPQQATPRPPPPRLPAPVTELPIIGELAGPTPVVLRGHVGVAQRQRLLGEAADVYADVSRRFLGASRARHRPVQLCVFESEAGYRRFVADVFGDGTYSTWGFYRADLRVAVANLSAGLGNLRHELVHPLVGDDFPGIPAWLNEGLGSLYGTAVLHDGHATFLVNYRLKPLHEAIRRGEAPGFRALVTSTADDVRGLHAAIYYATARYLLLYLERRGRLSEFYRTVRDERAPSERVLELLEGAADEDEFRAWAKGLSYSARR
jgi:hypothetical protein